MWNSVSAGFMPSIIGIALLLTACGGGGGGGGGGGDSKNSGDSSQTTSGSGENSNWPGNIIGERIEFTVVDGGDTGLSQGDVVIYEFNSNGQVVGENPVTGARVSPESYEYAFDGNIATVDLDYLVFGNPGFEEYTLDPYTSGDIARGTYTYRGDTGTSGVRRASGNYVILTRVEGQPETISDISNLDRVGGGSTVLNQYPPDSKPIGTFATVDAPNQQDGVAINSEGEVFSWVRSTILSDGTPNPFLDTPTQDNFRDARSYSLLGRAGRALTNEGDVWEWGDGNAPRSLTQDIDSSRDLPGPVEQITEHYQHLVLEDGTLYCAQLYQGLACDEWDQNPDYQNANGVVKAAYAESCLIYLDRYGKLGKACTVREQIEPTLPAPNTYPALIDFDYHYIFACSNNTGTCYRHAFIAGITENGEVLVWGWDGEPLAVPDEVAGNVVDIAVVNYRAVTRDRRRVAAVLSDGTLYTWRYDNDTDELTSASPFPSDEVITGVRRIHNGFGTVSAP